MQASDQKPSLLSLITPDCAIMRRLSKAAFARRAQHIQEVEQALRRDQDPEHLYHRLAFFLLIDAGTRYHELMQNLNATDSQLASVLSIRIAEILAYYIIHPESPHYAWWNGKGAAIVSGTQKARVAPQASVGHERELNFVVGDFNSFADHVLHVQRIYDAERSRGMDVTFDVPSVRLMRLLLEATGSRYHGWLDELGPKAPRLANAHADAVDVILYYHRHTWRRGESPWWRSVGSAITRGTYTGSNYQSSGSGNPSDADTDYDMDYDMDYDSEGENEIYQPMAGGQERAQRRITRPGANLMRRSRAM